MSLKSTWKSQSNGLVTSRTALLGIGTQVRVGFGYVALVAQDMETLQAAFSLLQPGTQCERWKTRGVGLIPLEETYPVGKGGEVGKKPLGHDTYPLTRWFETGGSCRFEPDVEMSDESALADLGVDNTSLADWWDKVGSLQVLP